MYPGQLVPNSMSLNDLKVIILPESWLHFFQFPNFQ